MAPASASEGGSAQIEPIQFGIGEAAYKVATEDLHKSGKLDLKGLRDMLSASYKTPTARDGALQSLVRSLVLLLVPSRAACSTTPDLDLT